MVILVITRSSWNTDNNTGNTLSNIFGGLSECEFHSLYLRSDPPKNTVARSYFHITEGQLLGSLLHRQRAGRAVIPDRMQTQAASHERIVYALASRWNSSMLWLAREWLWVLGRWKRGELDRYLKEINPDVIFMPAFGCLYPYRVLKHVAALSGAKTVIFHGDDNYSLRQFRFSPLFWINRLLLRAHIRTAARRASVNFCISEEQQVEYSEAFGVNCTLLRKWGDFSGSSPKSDALAGATHPSDLPLRFVFTGNITSGRWATLVRIGHVLEEVEADAVLHIYSHNIPSSRVQRKFSRCSAVEFHGGVPSEMISAIQDDADVLVHVESLRRTERLETRLSFSTKLVDYFERGKCILAVGWTESASIAYLLRNDSAVVATSPSQLKDRVLQVATDRALVAEYARKAWECGRRNHDKLQAQNNLHLEFHRVRPIAGRR